MTTPMYYILGVQVVTYLVLGVLYGFQGNWHFAIGQLLLAAVQAVIYTA